MNQVKFNNNYNEITIFLGNVPAQNIWISSRTENTLQKWQSLGVNTTLVNGEIVQNADVIFLTVKPQVLDVMIQETKESLKNDIHNKLFISVLAGVSIETLKSVNIYI